MSVVILTASASASADPPTPPPGAASLSLARGAWKKGDFDVAEPLYVKALDAGGLAPADVVDAYVHIGVARTVLGKNNPALTAFREAALLDAKFVLPSEAGPRAVYLANAARKEKAKFGAIALTVDAPTMVKPGASFTVNATLDAAHLTMAATLTTTVSDALSHKTFTHDEAPAPEITFTVPARMTLPGASLGVRVDALDAHANRLASVDKLIRVEGAAASSIAKTDVTHDPSRSGSSAANEKDAAKSHGGFWSSPWPYFIGGVALAAGGAAVFITTRQTDDVSVGAARVQAGR